MILYANGDSHTYGINLSFDQKFVKILADHFDMELINDSKVGASNDHILRITKEYLNIHRPDLVVIGWSSWEREEWMHENKYYNVNSSGHDLLPKDLETKYKQWVADQTTETLYKKSQQWHDVIYKFHIELTESKIPHVFFNCMYDFFGVCNQQVWNHAHVGPYISERSFYWYLTQHGFNADEWYHHGAEANQCWANFLIKHIEDHDIIR